MIPWGAQIAIGLVGSTLATGMTTVGNIFLSNGIQQGMMENQQKKQNHNNHAPKHHQAPKN